MRSGLAPAPWPLTCALVAALTMSCGDDDDSGDAHATTESPYCVVRLIHHGLPDQCPTLDEIRQDIVDAHLDKNGLSVTVDGEPTTTHPSQDTIQCCFHAILTASP